MMSVKEVCKLSGVSARTLHYYDSIGLLCPAFVSESGYRYYDNDNLERLHDILLFRELEFSLSDINNILSNPDFDRQAAIEQQIELLTLKKQRLEKLITHAKNIKQNGVDKMSFEEFNKDKINEYSRQAKEKWGQTEAFTEYESKGYSEQEEMSLADRLMQYFVAFGRMKNKNPASDDVQTQVRALQDFISKNYYNCTNQILASLGQMYCAGGEMTENIDKAGGIGTAEFTAKAIEIYCA